MVWGKAFILENQEAIRKWVIRDLGNPSQQEKGEDWGWKKRYVS